MGKITAGPERLDMLAGIPTLNSEDTISNVALQIGKAMEGRCDEGKCMIVDCDGGSVDNTSKNFLDTKTEIPKKVLHTPPGTTGKGVAFKVLFEHARKTGARTIIVNDADLRSINPEWVNLQLDSIEKHKYDYATPLYVRYKYDANITNHLCYPLIYAVFCRNIRQPIGGDFAFSGKLSDYWLREHWPPGANLFGIDIFMTAHAILGNSRICQLNLGAKVHHAKDPGKSLAFMFNQVVSTLFEIITANKERLCAMKKVLDVDVLGKEKTPKPQQMEIDEGIMKKAFTDGVREEEAVLKKYLPAEDVKRIKSCASSGDVSIDSELWARIVYSCILGYAADEETRDAFIGSLIPLWFGRVYSFVEETKDMETKKAEVLVRKEAEEFFKQRCLLLDGL